MTQPRRQHRTPAVLVLALLAGLVAMHGLSGTALAGPTHQGMPATGMNMDLVGGPAALGPLPAAPAPDAPHHGPKASGQHPCLAMPAASVDLVAAVEMLAPAPPQPQQATALAADQGRADRAPPDLHDLCVSRT